MTDALISSPDFVNGFEFERIEPWTTFVHHDQFRIESEQIGDIQIEATLNMIQRYGLCHLRLYGQTPDENTFRAFFESIGQVMPEQNLFPGDVKDITPKPDIEPNTGDSKGDLGFHVDGTQTPDQPALLAFQYVKPADVGGNSRFVDIAAILFDLERAAFERVLANLSVSDAATFEKSGMKLVSPIFHMPDGESLACRIRVDDVITVRPSLRDDFEILKSALLNEKYGVKFKPRAGDIVIFDNWRILHARDTVLGFNQRHHRRVWMEALLPHYQPYFRIGIRPLPVQLKATILANSKLVSS